MAKRSNYVNTSERVKVSEEKKYEVATNKAPETVRLVLLKDLTVKYTGPITGKLYVFSGGGAEVNVDADDAQIMLAKRGGQCCPGGSGPRPYFAEV